MYVCVGGRHAWLDREWFFDGDGDGDVDDGFFRMYNEGEFYIVLTYS